MCLINHLVQSWGLFIEAKKEGKKWKQFVIILKDKFADLENKNMDNLKKLIPSHFDNIY